MRRYHRRDPRTKARHAQIYVGRSLEIAANVKTDDANEHVRAVLVHDKQVARVPLARVSIGKITGAQHAGSVVREELGQISDALVVTDNRHIHTQQLAGEIAAHGSGSPSDGSRNCAYDIVRVVCSSKSNGRKATGDSELQDREVVRLGHTAVVQWVERLLHDGNALAVFGAGTEVCADSDVCDADIAVGHRETVRWRGERVAAAAQLSSALVKTSGVSLGSRRHDGSSENERCIVDLGINRSDEHDGSGGQNGSNLYGRGVGVGSLTWM